MFSVLSGSETVASSDDPAVTNSGAHEFLRAGDELLSHQTTADFDRALECYRRAIELAPKSAVARAGFVVAAVNKAALGSQNRELLEKAERYGRRGSSSEWQSRIHPSRIGKSLLLARRFCRSSRRGT